MQVYQETIDFLASRYPDKAAVVQFDQADTRALYDQLSGCSEPRGEEPCRQEIRQAFADYLKEIGRCVVLFRGRTTIGVRLNAPHRISADAPAFKTVVGLLKEQENTIFSASGREDLLVVDEPLLKQLSEALKAHPEAIDRRDALRRATRKAFSLKPNDAVVFLGGRLYVRLFVTQGAFGGHVERRFGGLPPEELEQLKQDLFKESVDSVLISLIDELSRSGLDFNQIDNDYYELNALRLIQGSISRYLRQKLDHEKEVIDAFSAYLLRENFMLVHRVLAEALLEAVMQNAEKAESFLKYYTGEVAMFEGQKYQLPEIVDKQGMRWNFSVIKAITTQYAREQVQSESRKEQLTQIASDLSEIDAEIETAKKTLEAAKKEQVTARVAVEESGNRLSTLREELQKARKEAARSGQSESDSIASLTNRIREQTSEDEQLFKARSRADTRVKECERAVESLERKRRNLSRKTGDEQGRLEQHAQSQEELTGRFELLCDALALALTKRKRKL